MNKLVAFWVGCAIVLSGGLNSVNAQGLDSAVMVETCDNITTDMLRNELGINNTIDLKLEYGAVKGFDDGLIYAFDTIIESWQLRIHALQYTWDYFECSEVMELYRKDKGLTWDIQ